MELAPYRPLCCAGVDEVGRGPLAGPVVAAAVILDPSVIPMGLDDSKRLSAARRFTLSKEIRCCALSWSIAWCDPAEIDALNILNATLLAMLPETDLGTRLYSRGHCRG